MIDAPVWQWLERDAGVKAALGDPPRVYPFDDAPHAEGLVYPYCVWHFIAGSNFSTLCGNSNTESSRLQFDVYAKTVKSARAAAQAVESALSDFGYTVSYNARIRDPQTKNYRYSWDFECIMS